MSRRGLVEAFWFVMTCGFVLGMLALCTARIIG